MNPVTFSTGILVAVALICAEPVIVVALPTCNCPPTALTLSFSNTVVDSVPLIFTFCASIIPLSAEDILTPFSPLTKSVVSRLVSVIANPPIVPPVEVISPSVFTSNFAVLISSPDALNLIKLLASPTKLNLPVPSR